jgi:hypothetical protein
MNKTTISLITLLAVGGTAAVGGNLYADSQLKRFYQPNPAYKQFKIQTQQYHMGVMDGQVNWTADWIANLCAPDQDPAFKLRGEDHIRRTLGGYQIQSKIYLVSKDKPDGIFLFNSHSDVSRGGTIHNTTTLPANQYQDTANQFSASWQEASFKMTLQRKQERFDVDTVEFNLPQLNLQSTNNDFPLTMQLDKLNYQSNIALGNSQLRSGEDKLSLESLSLNSSDKWNFKLHKLNNHAQQTINEQSVDLSNQLNIESIDVLNQPFTHIQYQVQAKAISKAAFEQFSTLIQRQAQECVDQQALESELKKIAQSALSQGINVDANSKLYLNNSTLNAQANAKLPAGEYPINGKPETLIREIQNKLQYQSEVKVDKDFIRQIIGISQQFSGQTKHQLSAEDEHNIEELIRNIPGARDEGNKIVISSKK